MRRQFNWFTQCLIAAVLLLGMTGLAWGGDRDHEDGFFMRLSLGGGTATTEIDNEFERAELSGPSGDVNFAFGGIIAPNLALHGTLFGWSLSDPDVTLNGRDMGAGDGTVTLGALGIGLTYYIMPANFYLSGSIGAGSIEFDATGGESEETDLGLAIDVTAGKEWWVGNSWALGVAAGLGMHSIADKDIDGNWTGTSFAIRFTVTKN